LSAHIAEVDAWHLLSEEVLDELDSEALVADVMRAGFGSTLLPPEVAAVLGTCDRLAGTRDPARRRAIRRTGLAWSSGPSTTGAGAAPWSIVWLRVPRRPVHVVLGGHTGAVGAVAAVPLPDGRLLLATGSADATVRLWDPITGSPVGEPLTGHTSRVDAVAVVRLADGRTLLATGSSDATVRLWDPATGSPVGDPLTGHTSGVIAVAAVPLPDGRTLLGTGSTDTTVRLWDLTTGSPVGGPLTGHAGAVEAVAAVQLPDGRTLLATGSTDTTVRLWDLERQQKLLTIDVLAPLSGLSVHGEVLVAAVPRGLVAVRAADHVLQGSGSSSAGPAGLR
jgi:WD40 repeat protein